MLVELEHFPEVSADTFKQAVAVKNAVIVEGDIGFGSGEQLAVDVYVFAGHRNLSSSFKLLSVCYRVQAIRAAE